MPNICWFQLLYRENNSTFSLFYAIVKTALWPVGWTNEQFKTSPWPLTSFLTFPTINYQFFNGFMDFE